jgi:hypothetical protein
MDDKILIAAIAAGSAVLGAAFPTMISIWINKRQREFEIKKYLLGHQQAAYLALLYTLQDLFNNQSNQNVFRDFQKIISRVAMYGSKQVADASQQYYSDMVSQSQGQRAPLTKSEGSADLFPGPWFAGRRF